MESDEDTTGITEERMDTEEEKITHGYGVALPSKVYNKGSRLVQSPGNSFTRKRYFAPFRRKGTLEKTGNFKRVLTKTVVSSGTKNEAAQDTVSGYGEHTFDVDDRASEFGTEFSFQTIATTNSENRKFLCQLCSSQDVYRQMACLHVLCYSCGSLTVDCELCNRLKNGTEYEFFVKRVQSNGNIFVGRPTSSNQEKSFLILPRSSKIGYFEIQCRQKRNRIDSLLETANYFASGSSEISMNTVLIIEDALEKSRKTLKVASDLQKTWKISLETEIVVMKLLNLSKNARRELKQELIRREEDFLNSNGAYEKEVDELVLKKVKMETMTKVIDPNDCDMDYSEIDVNLERYGSSKIANISEVLQEYLEKTSESIVLNGKFNGELWLRVGIDKGGQTSKCMTSFANRPQKMVNSPFNWITVAAWNGNDKYGEIKQNCGNLLEEIGKLKELKINGTSYPLKKFIVSDLNAMSAIMGLKGPASRYPCANCTTTMDDMKVFEANGTERTSTECENCLNMTSSSTKFTKSYDNPPLIPFDEVVLVPMQLHCFVSPVSEIFKLLETLTQLIERSKLTGEQIGRVDLKISAQGQWDKVRSASVQEHQLRQKALNEAVFWKEKCDELKIPPQETQQDCYPFCLFRKLKKASTASRVICNDCGKSEHKLCGGIGENEKISHYKCWTCSKVSKDFMDLKLSQMKRQCDETSKEIVSKQCLLDAARCETAQEFRKMSDRLGVRLGAFQGKLLPGNHVRNFLRNNDEFFDFVENLTDDGDLRLSLAQLRNITKSVSTIHQLSCSRFLTSDEITTIENAAENLKNVLMDSKVRTGSPKYHYIIHEIPKFVRKYGTLGLLSEQGLESQHVQYENALNRFKFMKELGKKFERAIFSSNNRNIALLINNCHNLLQNEMPVLTQQ